MVDHDSVFYSSNYIKRLETMDIVLSNLMYQLEGDRSIDNLRAVKEYLNKLDLDTLQEYVIYMGLDPYAEYWYEGKENVIYCLIVAYAQSMLSFDRGYFLQFIFYFYDQA